MQNLGFKLSYKTTTLITALPFLFCLLHITCLTNVKEGMSLFNWSVFVLDNDLDTSPVLQQAGIQSYVTWSLFKDKLLFQNNVAGNRASERKPQVERNVFITMRHWRYTKRQDTELLFLRSLEVNHSIFSPSRNGFQ